MAEYNAHLLAIESVPDAGHITRYRMILRDVITGEFFTCLTPTNSSYSVYAPSWVGKQLELDIKRHKYARVACWVRVRSDSASRPLHIGTRDKA